MGGVTNSIGFSSELAVRELKHWVRVPGQVVSGLILTPLIWLGLFGLSFQASAPVSGLGGPYVDFITPAVAAMMVLATSAPGSMCIVLDRSRGFLNRLLVLPISRSTIAAGYLMELTAKSVLQVAATLLIAGLLGVQVKTGVGGIALIIVFGVLLGFGFACVGLAMALRVDDPGAFAGMANMIVMPLLFLTPAFFPLSQLPGWLETLTRLNPVAYFVNPVRLLILQGYDWPLIGQGLGVLLAFDTLSALGISWLFNRVTAS